MYQYFSFNILYSIIVFLFLYPLKTAPHNIRFRFVMLGLLSWLLPYDLINNYFIQNNAVMFSSAISEFNGSIKHVIVSNIRTETFITLLNLIKLMTFIGLALFIKDLVSLRTQIKHLKNNSTLQRTIDEINIYSIHQNDIFTAGIINPRIYLGEKHLNSPYVESIIQHELQHIKHHDQYWLLLITFVQRILWWNPIVLLLANKGRQLIELRCDESCNKQSKDNQYQQDLAQILLSQNNQVSNRLISHLIGKPNLNIFRIKQLSQEFNMNKKHKVLIFSTALTPLVLMLFVSTASVSSENTITNNRDDKKSIKKDVNFDTMPIKENQAKIVLDAHIYVDDPNVAINTKDTSANLKTNFNTHKSFAANYVVNLGKHFSMESNEMLDFKIDILPTVIEGDSLMFATNIQFSSLGESIKINPSLTIRRHDTGHIILDDENGLYKFELFITVRQ